MIMWLINPWTINSVCAPLAALEVDVKRSDHLRNLQLADTFLRAAASAEVLVGADQYYKLVQGDVRKGHPGTLIATKSKLGWLLSGPITGSRKSEEMTAMLTVMKIESSDDQLKRLLGARCYLDRESSGASKNPRRGGHNQSV